MTRTKKKPDKGIALNDFQIAALAKAYSRGTITIKRWAKKNHYALTTPIAQQIIEQYKNQPQIPVINV